MHRLILQLTFCIFLIENFPRIILTFLLAKKREEFSDKRISFVIDRSLLEN